MILMLSLSLSCKKKAADVNQNYVGYWSGYDSDKDYSLSIESNSKAVYETFNGEVSVSVKGKAKINGGTMKIFTKKFSIDQEPLQDSQDPSKFTMVLNGVPYEREF